MVQSKAEVRGGDDKNKLMDRLTDIVARGTKNFPIHSEPVMPVSSPLCHHCLPPEWRYVSSKVVLSTAEVRGLC